MYPSRSAVIRTAVQDTLKTVGLIVGNTKLVSVD